MQLKMDNGNVVVQDGKPVYVADDGKEIAFDYVATLGTISRLNGEAKSHRERAEAAAERLKLFEGIEDPAAAREALEKMRDVDFSKLVHAGKIDEVRTEAQKAFDQKLRSLEETYKPVIAERDGLRASLHQEIVGGSFSRSKYIAEKMTIPADMVQNSFGRWFKVEEGNKIVARDSNGNEIYSRTRPGEPATFDEALETLVEQYPHRDHILKGTGASGSGASGGIGINGRRTMTRAQFDALPPTERMQAVKEVALVD